MTTRDDLVSRLRDVIRYDKKTGHLIWLKDNGRAKAGHPAGWKKSNGYIEVGVLGARYKAHRLVWLLTYGCLPTVDIDHINGDRADNRLANPRLANRHQNNWNTARPCTNKSGVKGVSFHKMSRKWSAYINRDNRQIHLGLFETIEAAEAAIRQARVAMHGEFAHHG